MWQAVIGFAVATVAATFGWILRARMPREHATWPVECRDCHKEYDTGPRRQLFVQLWDTHGMMYASWPVGVGELLASQAPGPWLWDRITQDVARLNKFQAFGVRVLDDKPGANLSGSDIQPVGL